MKSSRVIRKYSDLYGKGLVKTDKNIEKIIKADERKMQSFTKKELNSLINQGLISKKDLKKWSA